ncbi:MAG: ABC transporter permease, partial [Bacillales bacterium]|nr:ABC transporter permease [Bacillales bacterium]
MLKYVIKRILLLIMTLIIITAISFILIRLMPYPKPTEGDNAANIIAYLDSIGFYEPMPYQMWLYVKRLFETGSFGMSYHLWPAHSFEALLLKKIPATIVVNLYSVILAIPLGLFLGILAALKKNKLTDQTISIAVIAFISVPSFIYAFLFQYFFAYKWPILPLRMYMGEDFFSLRMFPSIILPIISLALGSIAGIARYTRAELIEVLTGEYMFLARTKGLSRGQATV